MTRGAVFDWDGVIINSAAQHAQSWDRLAAETGFVLPADHFKRGFGMKNQVIIPKLLGWTEVPAEIERLSLRKEELYRELVKSEGMEALPGVKVWLERLRAAGVPCAIGSSTHRENITVTLEVLGLGAFFSAIISAEDVAHGKPDPEVFLKAAQAIGSGPGQAIVFEDARVGIAAAKAAGMRVAAVTTTHTAEELREAAPDWIVMRLDELSVEQLWS